MNGNHDINQKELTSFIDSQLKSFFPDKYKNKDIIKENIDEALDKIMYSLKHVKLPGYTSFTNLHSDLYAKFLYVLSNTVWVNTQNKILSAKLFYLNKALHGINCMYDTKLPDIFLFIHCVGTVLGKAEYSNFLVVSQNVTVGTNKGESPQISEGVYLAPKSSVVGKCRIAKYTSCAIGTTILDEDTRENCVVIGNSPNLVLKDAKRNFISEVFFKI